MDLLKKEMRIEKERAMRSFLKNSKVSGMKVAKLPGELADLGIRIGDSLREFDKFLKKASVETITLADEELRWELGEYLDDMESTLKMLIAKLSVLADDVRDDKTILAIVESNETTL
jgi:hypothetical protein